MSSHSQRRRNSLTLQAVAQTLLSYRTRENAAMAASWSLLLLNTVDFLSMDLSKTLGSYDFP